MEFLHALDEFLYSPIDRLIDSEVWKVIPDYPNYEVSNLGRIRNSEDHTILAPRKHNKGYHLISLRNNEGLKVFLVHRLIAQVWIPNPEGKPCIDHKDGDRTNNEVSNLRWVTYSENNMNTRKQNNRSSIYKGVDFKKQIQKYRVRITIDGIRRHLGLFDDPKEAAQVYNEMAIKYYGKFARLNIIK